MSAGPLVHFFVHDDPHPLRKTDLLWQERLPMNRQALSAPGEEGVRYGEYFSAIERFLIENDFERLNPALAEPKTGVNKSVDPEQIRITMEKHGQFYHPARIVVDAGGKAYFFVVNVAVSRIGQRVIEGEFRCLKKLRESFAEEYVPRALAIGQVDLENGGCLSLFLGEWFDRFHEFHLTALPEGKKGITVWDATTGRYPLSVAQAILVYRRATYILTHYYNLFTGEQIFPWHHAAGDFVLRNEGGELVLRLISVRQYAAMLEPDEKDPAAMWNGLLLFFLNLSLRMRLDRLDGVGEIVWAEDYALEGIANGFLEGLTAKKPPEGETRASLMADWQAYFSSFSVDELMLICNSIINTWAAEAPETPIVRRNLRAHVSGLKASMGAV